MNLRIARHVGDLDEMIYFYNTLLGMKILGEFENHSGYDGVFLGFENQNWHLEFTISNEKPNHKFDEDDLMVFYLENDELKNRLINNLRKNNIKEVSPKNPYWKENGTLFLDPEGCGIIITKKKEN